MVTRVRQPSDIPVTFNSITIRLASPELILEQSYGEVTKPETINYRTLKPEPGGLFCERIFGPVKDYECACGKYKRARYKGIVCDHCGVEVTERRVRRERIGHITLEVPVVHVWFFRGAPNIIALLLGYSSKEVEQIVYYERYVVIQPGLLENQLERGQLLTEEEYEEVLKQIPEDNDKLPDSDPHKVIIKQGGEALAELLKRLDLDELSSALHNQAMRERSRTRRNEILRRLQIVEAFRKARERGIENRPEWMIIKVLPVIPPELRPLVPLEGGKFASSDLNELYRRVIIRNNRLRRLREIRAPEIIIRNEKRMLQEAVDALLDNSRRINVQRGEEGRPLKSLTDSLKGKKGRFRQNLLGKRVDYSGRSVIVVGPELKMHECGLPKEMALELFKPFVIRWLIERHIAKTVKAAKQLIERRDPIIWEVLEHVVQGHPVLLNRAPTLHRLSIQAFQPRLVEGKAIQLHPLVCTPYNADFDGDQMAVHVPLSHAAIAECYLLMLSTHNILNPQNGAPITVPSQDMVLGLYYLTKPMEGARGEGKVFYGPEEALIAYEQGVIDLHARIKVRVPVRDPHSGELKPELIETTVGRVIFNEVVPKELGFINLTLTKSVLRDIIAEAIRRTNFPRVAKFLDDIKEMGFRLATRGGLSFKMSDLVVPAQKREIFQKAQEEVARIIEDYNMGLITQVERYNRIIDVWMKVTHDVTELVHEEMKKDQGGFNPIFMMLDSGARGSKDQIRQLVGLRGLMAKPRGGLGSEIIENPILSSLKEGLSVLEYFISTHGARKGLADTALKTADAGYLTRRLVDVAHEVVITEEDCGTIRGIRMSALKDQEEVVVSLKDRILGRVALDDIYHPQTGELICKAGQVIDEEIAEKIENSPIEEVWIRSVMTCETRNGVCAKCYGWNLAYNRMAQVGDAVGIIAAQSIGEPGTQLTLRTFHTGGAAVGEITERVIRARFAGRIRFHKLRYVVYEEMGAQSRVVVSKMGHVEIVDSDGFVLIRHRIPYGAILYVEDGQEVDKETILCTWDPDNLVIVAEHGGEIRFEHVIEGVTYREEVDEQTGHRQKVIIESRDRTGVPMVHVVDPVTKETLCSYNLPTGSHLLVKEGEQVSAGKILAKIPRIKRKLADITGGLPRVVELFEARSPSNPAILAEIDGVVKFGNRRRGNQLIIVESPQGERREYWIPLSRYILVEEGDEVRAGTPLCDGPIAPMDILNILGPTALQKYLVNEVQEVYRLQGVTINEKHIEVIVRQMLRKVVIEDPGDTTFLQGEIVDKFDFMRANEELYGKKVVLDPGDAEEVRAGQVITLRQLREINSRLKREDKKLIQYRDTIFATAKPIVLGITRVALSTHSWISAASFQDTARVLMKAAIEAQRDELLGLKENVIVGHLIPAGTGMRHIQRVITASRKEYEEMVKAQEMREPGGAVPGSVETETH